MPSVMSTDRIAFFDPFEKQFGKGETGREVLIDKDLFQKYHDQFSPFANVLGIGEEHFSRECFDGTLFRFPLRKTPSPELSSTVFTVERVKQLFESFKEDADITLLFLKYVTHVSFYERISSDDEILVFEAKNIIDSSAEREKFLESLSVRFSPIAYFAKHCIKTNSQGDVSTQQWFVLNSVFTDLPERMKALADELKFLPWIGLAIPFQTDKVNTIQGRVFCFLPLPSCEESMTGLPVHIHGYFGLNDNRRSIKWPAADQKHDPTAEWNQYLVKDLLPKAYSMLIVHASQISSNPKDIYRAWPTLEYVKPHFSDMTDHFIQIISDEKVLHLHNSPDEGKLISLYDSVLNTLKSEYIDPDVENTVVNYLSICCHKPVVSLPENVMNCLLQCKHKSKRITPTLLRDCVRTFGVTHCTREKKNLLLKYCLHDREFSDLYGISLLPLANGSHATFSSDCHVPPVLLPTHENPQILLPKTAQSSHFIDVDLPSDVMATLKEIAGKNVSQLRYMKAPDVGKFMPEVLPQEWLGQSIVEWTPTRDTIPPEEWLKTLWAWLQKNFADDISDFHDLPIVPIKMTDESYQLMKLDESIPAIYTSADEPFTHGRSCLTRMGAVILEKFPFLNYSVLQRYILPPSPCGVLKLLSKCGDKLSLLDLAPSEERYWLRHMLAGVDKLSPTECALVSRLPIFEKLPGSGRPNVNEFISLGSKPYIAPLKVHFPNEIRFKHNLVKMDDLDSQRLQALLNVTSLTLVDVVVHHIFPQIKDSEYLPVEVDTVMIWILTDLSMVIDKNQELLLSLKSLPFVKCNDCKRVSPADAFDPDDEVLKILFEGEDVFPQSPFTNPEVLTMLRKLGLKKQSDLIASDLLTIATLCESCDSNEFYRVLKASTLLKYINSNSSLLSDKLDGKTVAEHLMRKMWIPSLKTRPPNYPCMIPWYEDARLLYSPTEVFPLDTSKLVGAVKPVIKDDVCDNLREYFKWEKTPPLEVLVEQLHITVDTWDRGKTNTHINGNQTQQVEAYTCDLYISIQTLYQKCSFSDQKKMIECLDGLQFPWLWNGDDFSYPNQMAKKSTVMFDLRPHRFQLPRCLHGVFDLLEQCGVRREFCDDDMLSILEVIAEKAPLRRNEIQEDLQLTINILEWLNADDKVVDGRVRERLLVPVQGHVGILQLSLCQSCTYCDNERLLEDEETQMMLKEDGINVTHRKLSNETARSLGIPPISKTIAKPDPLGFKFEATGPYEPVTTRLRNILHDYTDGVNIFKELIQNADDAGATDVKFLIDWRSNDAHRKTLFCKEVESCQGPALWAYNNAVFSDTDLENIGKLAGATKQADTNKIGKFGLGFNSVYHITDLPSFITRDFFVMFDPNATHIPNLIRNKSQPGIKINISENPISLKLYSDQFRVFKGIFGCNPDEHLYYEATLFRFPLRTQSDGQKSQISSKVYDMHKIKNLLENLQRHTETLLLFTQNVTKIEVYEIQHANGKPADKELCFTLKLEDIQPIVNPTLDSTFDKEKTRQILSCGTQYLRDVKSSITEHESPPPISYTVKISCICAFDGTVTHQTDCVCAVCSSISEGDAMAMALSNEGRTLGLLPCGSVAVKLTCLDSGKLSLGEIDGEAFCYLPLHIKTYLPIHVNGGFATESHRRDICKYGLSDMVESTEVKWNNVLMREVISKAYVTLLQDLLQNERVLNPMEIYQLWPNTTSSEKGSFFEVVRGFYDRIVGKIRNQKLPKLFLQDPYINGDWNLTLNCSRIVEQRNEKLREKARKVVNDRLAEQSESFVRTVNVSSKILHSFKRLELCEVIDQVKISERMFYHEYMFPHLDKLEGHIRDSFLIDILLRHNHFEYEERKYLAHLLKQYPCIPTSPNGITLTKISNLIDPTSTTLAPLFDEADKRFPFGEYTKPMCLFRLCQLGMASKELHKDDVIERACSIQQKYKHDKTKAMTRLSHLIQYLESKGKIYNENDLQDIYEIKFLPVLKRPDDYPFPWFETSEWLLAPSELYLRKHQDIVSTVCPILNDNNPENGGCGKLPHEVEKILSFKTKPDAETTIKQLVNIIESKNMSPKTNTTENICKHIYRHLQNMITSVKKVFEYGQNTKEIVTIKDENALHKLLQCRKPLFLVGGKFAFSNMLAVSWEKDYAPYLYRMPDYLLKFKHLLHVCGVREKFTMEDFANALTQIAEHQHGDALTKDKLSMVIDLLQQFENEKPIPSEILQKLYLPDEEGVLHHSNELAYNDAQWIKTDSDELRFVHPKLSRDLVQQLGVKTIRSKKLDNYSTSEGFFIGEDFGQNEDLTDRLRGILSDYPFGKSIFQELVQNADDAKATEIHFVYDKRQHCNENLLSEEWKNLHGPAVCVYNDRPFSKEDIDGIKKLGIGAKRDISEAIGQYGIGFNSVYHLTDCPSFITNNEELIILDPQAKYIPGATKDYPGRRIKVQQMREDFPNVLTPFMEGHFELDQATMFRLPLRKANADSYIVDEACTDSKIQDLLEDFRCDLYHMPLFLNHIQKISLSEMSPDGSFQSLASVQVEINENESEKRVGFSKAAKSYARRNKEDPSTFMDIPETSVTYYMSVREPKEVLSKWLVTQQVGFSQPIAKQAYVSLQNMAKHILPRGGLAILIKSNKSEEPSQLKSQAFCFLPLPIKTGLPFLLNGHFALSSDRRNLCTYGSKNLWNDLIKMYIIAPAFIDTLRHLKCRLSSIPNDIEDEIDNYHSIFPILEDVNSDWKDVTKQIYKLVNLSKEALFPVITFHEITCTSDCSHYVAKCEAHFSLHWYSLQDVYFNAETKQNDKDSDSSKLLQNILREIGLPLTALSGEVYQSVRDSEISATNMSPEDVTFFLRGETSIKPNIGILPRSIVDTPFGCVDRLKIVLNYSLQPFISHSSQQDDSKIKLLETYLDNAPLCLTKSYKLQTFNNFAPVFVSTFSSLIPQMEDKFVSDDIINDLEHLTTPNLQCPATVCFGLHDLVLHLHMVLPTWLKRSTKYVEWGPGKDKQPSESWMKTLWNFFLTRKRSGEKWSKHCQSVLRVINEWSVIPTKDNYLVPGCLRKTVLESSYPRRDTTSVCETYKLLKMWGCPMVNYDAIICQKTDISEYFRGLLQECVATVSNRSDVINVLSYHFQRCDLNERLTIEDCTTLLKFFQEDIATICDNMNTLSKLKSLPIFITAFGSLTSINEHIHCYVLTDQIPDIECDIWMRQSKCTILEEIYTLEDIHKRVCDGKIDICNVYCHHILPQFANFSSKAKLVHMECLRDKIQYCHAESQKNLYRAISKVEFLPDPNGSQMLFRANHFFDPRNAVFKEMLQEEDFPPTPYDGDIWLEFLVELGLQTEVSDKNFIEFARKIGKDALPQARERAELLLQTLFRSFESANVDHKRFATLHDPTFLGKIADIEFIPSCVPDENVIMLHPLFNRGFICFAEAIPSKYTYLAWTKAPILPSWADPSDQCSKFVSEKLYEDLKIHTEPPTKTVIEHGTCIGRSVAARNGDDVQELTGSNSKESAVTLQRVMKMIYQFLMEKCNQYQHELKMCDRNTQKNLCAHCQDMSEMLTDVPFVVVGDGLMISASKVTLRGRLDEQLIPYIFDLPEHLFQFASLFKLFGTQEYPNVTHYLSALEDMYQKNGSMTSELNKIDLLKASDAICGMFALLEEASREACLPDLEEHTIYLLSDSNRLHESKRLVFNDLHRSKELVEDLDCNFLGENQFPMQKNPKIYLRCLPKEKRPTYLSHLVEEKLKDIQPCIHQPRCAFEDDYKLLVTSDEFCDAICQLMVKNEINVTDEIRQLVDNLKALGIKCIGNVKLQLFRRDNDNPIPRSEKKVPVYLSLENQQCCVYLDHHSMCKPDITLLVDFAEIICQLLQGEATKIFGKIQKLLNCHIPENIAYYLNYEGCLSIDDAENYQPPIVGSNIPVERMKQLVQHPNHFFRRKEYVGHISDMSSCAPTFIYARIVKEYISTDTRKCDAEYNVKRIYEIDVSKQESLVVTGMTLYKLSRLQTHTMKNEGKPTKTTKGGNLPHNLEETLKELSEFLEETVSDDTLTDEQCKFIIKRLYMHWHPGNNLGNEHFTTKVYEHVRKEVKRLDDKYIQSKDHCQYSRQTYSQYFSEWESEVHTHKKGQETSHEDRETNLRSGYERFLPLSEHYMKPDPIEAERWFRQAEADFKAASKDLEDGESNKSYEWVCFKCQQATEKAMKAGLFFKGRMSGFGHHIASLACSLSTESSGVDVMDDVRALVNLNCDNLHPRYPDMYHGSTIPNDVYDKETATRTLQHTKNILAHVSSLLRK